METSTQRIPQPACGDDVTRNVGFSLWVRINNTVLPCKGNSCNRFFPSEQLLPFAFTRYCTSAHSTALENQQAVSAYL